MTEIPNTKPSNDKQNLNNQSSFEFLDPLLFQPSAFFGVWIFGI
jgi:hypothetical protein